MPRQPTQLLGKRFGRLEVVEDAGYDKRGHWWICICDCSKRTTVRSANLMSGNTTSCGCYHAERQREVPKTHGKHGSRTWNIWANMRQRCSNPNASGWDDYGGRGIRVCSEWQSFEAFYADMGDVPDGYSIERIDANGHYCKDNCKWIPRALQARNTRQSHVIEFGGKTLPLVEWAEKLGMKYYTLHSRIKRGWSVERALTAPTGEPR